MNKAELVSVMANAADIKTSQANKALEVLLETICNELKNGEKVTLVNFGTFSVGERKPRTGRNPRTKEAIEIPAKKVPKFKPGKQMTVAVQ